MDKARKWTDEQLQQMEKRIRKIYKQARREITAEWDKYMKHGQERLSVLYDLYVNADYKDKQAAKQAYQDALNAYTLKNNRYRDMIADVTLRLAKVNQIAIDYLNGEMPQIYQVNYNQAIRGIKQLGIDFTIVDEATIERRITDGDITLPRKELNITKDMLWNTKQLNSSLLQGLLQGESIVKIAERILPIVGNNENAAIRNARTMVTGAENQGRLDRYKQLEKQGAVLNKVWIATHDGRVRDWHLTMDGQEVGIHQKFTDGNGYQLDYPGDPSAHPSTVYNCRCSMKTNIIGVKSKTGRITYL